MGDTEDGSLYCRFFAATESRMSRHLIVIVTLVALSHLSGCGNKGPLYLPDPATATSSDNATAAGD